MKQDSGSELVGDAGFDEFLRARAGKPLGFLVPSLGRKVDFDAVSLGAGCIDGEAVARFRPQLGGLLGRIAPSVEVAYTTDDRSLRRFTGLTNQRDDSGRPLRARIDFPQARHPAAAGSWTGVLAVPLVACSLGR